MREVARVITGWKRWREKFRQRPDANLPAVVAVLRPSRIAYQIRRTRRAATTRYSGSCQASSSCEAENTRLTSCSSFEAMAAALISDQSGAGASRMACRISALGRAGKPILGTVRDHLPEGAIERQGIIDMRRDQPHPVQARHRMQREKSIVAAKTASAVCAMRFGVPASMRSRSMTGAKSGREPTSRILCQRRSVLVGNRARRPRHPWWPGWRLGLPFPALFPSVPEVADGRRPSSRAPFRLPSDRSSAPHRQAHEGCSALPAMPASTGADIGGSPHRCPGARLRR